MRVQLIGILLLFSSCVHEKVPAPVVSRPPPFWPPHEFTNPPQQEFMTTMELRRFIDLRVTDNRIINKLENEKK